MNQAPAGKPYTRDEFERRRALRKAVESRETRILAIVSVGLGFGQLFLIRWMDAQADPRFERWDTPIAGVVFLLYMALVVWLLWRMQVRVRAATPTCPQCGHRLTGYSESVAAATRNCDSCGGRVIDGLEKGVDR